MLTDDDLKRGLLDDADIARLLGVPPRTVRWWRLSGQLRYLRCGRHPRVLRRDLEAFLDARASDAEGDQ
jgi:excisionase family DNA binding protein